MSDEAWDKMLEGIDKFIEAFRERLREMIRQQQEAALKAAAEAPSELKSVATSQAALDVAANGFFGGTTSETEEDTETEAIVGEDPGVDHENNWTKKLKTDDQTILRTAKAAQEMESKALQRMEEFLSGEYSGHGLYWNNLRSEYYKGLMRQRKNEAVEV